jgi:hypothetical protein
LADSRGSLCAVQRAALERAAQAGIVPVGLAPKPLPGPAGLPRGYAHAPGAGILSPRPGNAQPPAAAGFFPAARQPTRLACPATRMPHQRR